ncbi:hypothetical protein PEL8287_03151 [Roseovarius litorisediminis]|uniref:DUF2062 domain-containing protein n=1 Tax=Roseovarius litorisediminis TaxID=1312363 RepID=A0A1Y5TET1_9RHOB|nr:DUF2062 domain-containing protein [Roseovarius litorisediminis]SLN58667.1 hypothetical protein PEL8287_03151 [Roseovarius litorisediminis]
MVFKRRDRRPAWKVVSDFFWPKGGWTRAFHYVKHRLRRLPDPPHRIARGIFAGIFVTYSPFFGMHFVAAILVAWILRGNIVAALLATFFGNPVTFVPIAAISLQTGYFLLGKHISQNSDVHHSLGEAFVGAGRDLKENLFALFTDANADWTDLHIFYDEVFFPYMIGGIIPGLITGLIGYYVSLPLIQAYQNRRKGAIKAKWEAMKEKAAAKADAKKNPD